MPKDVTFGIIGFACAVLVAFRSEAQPWQAAIDLPAAAFLCWGAVLAFFAATNSDVAWRNIANFSAAVGIFMVARTVAGRPRTERVFFAMSVLIAMMSSLVLLEAFGAIPFISTIGLRPGATLGNRNLAARVGCLSLPILWYLLVLSNRKAVQRGIIGMVILTVAAIVISRSRGTVVVGGLLITALPLATLSLSGVPSAARSATRWWSIAVLTGALLAVWMPNRLGWRPADFASSATRVFEYRSGTGRGRVVQAITTARMIRENPIRGFGPGNWSVHYPAFARPGDPSVRLNAFYPAPRVPRNDMLALTAEYGVPALALVLIAIIALAAIAVDRIRRREFVLKQSGLLILGVAGGSALLGAFDSVLRVPPTLAIIALTIGLALSTVPDTGPTATYPRGKWRVAHRALCIGYAFCSLFLALAAFQDIASLRIVASARTIEDLHRAVIAAPNNVESRMLLAHALAGAQRCRLAKQHLAWAYKLQPHSGAVRRLANECDGQR